MAQPRIAIDPIKPYGFTVQGTSASDYPKPKVAKPPAAPVSNGINPTLGASGFQPGADLMNLIRNTSGVGDQTVAQVLAKVAAQDATYQDWWKQQNPGLELGTGQPMVQPSAPKVAIDPGPGSVTAALPTIHPAMQWLVDLAGYHPKVDPKAPITNPYGQVGPVVQATPSPTTKGPDLNALLRSILG